MLRYEYLDMSGNKINSIYQDTFTQNTALEWLNLKGNSITDVRPPTFQNNRWLRKLYVRK